MPVAVGTLKHEHDRLSALQQGVSFRASGELAFGQVHLVSLPGEWSLPSTSWNGSVCVCVCARIRMTWPVLPHVCGINAGRPSGKLTRHLNVCCIRLRLTHE